MTAATIGTMHSSTPAPSTLQQDSIATRDGVRLALWQVGSGRGVPVVLTHGTFSNHKSCMAFADYLAALGFACWVLDWRGHGASERPQAPYTLDDVAMYDVPAAIEAVRARSGGQRLYWVGHSGGGLIASMWMARHPQAAARQIGGVVLMASQSTGAASRRRHRMTIALIHRLLAYSKRAPGHWLGIGPEPEEALLMRQWCRWNLSGVFASRDGFDYLAALPSVDVPVLGLAGSRDTFIAPAPGCEALVSAYGSTDRTFHLCGRRQGFREDYTHQRLILSRNASGEIWPLIATWLGRTAAANRPGTST
jgi:pimeloyl-ACP methyl ester carboxylesterase